MIPVNVHDALTIRDMPMRATELGDTTKVLFGGTKGHYRCKRIRLGDELDCGIVYIWWNKGGSDGRWGCNNFKSSRKCCKNRCYTERL